MGFSAPSSRARFSFLFLQLRRFRVGKTCASLQTCVSSVFKRILGNIDEIFFSKFYSRKTNVGNFILFRFIIFCKKKKRTIGTNALRIKNFVKTPIPLLLRHLPRPLAGLPQRDYSLLLYRHSYSHQALSHRLTVLLLLLKITSSLPTTRAKYFHVYFISPEEHTCMILINNRITRFLETTLRETMVQPCLSFTGRELSPWTFGPCPRIFEFRAHFRLSLSLSLFFPRH